MNKSQKMSKLSRPKFKNVLNRDIKKLGLFLKFLVGNYLIPHKILYFYYGAPFNIVFACLSNDWDSHCLSTFK